VGYLENLRGYERQGRRDKPEKKDIGKHEIDDISVAEGIEREEQAMIKKSRRVVTKDRMHCKDLQGKGEGKGKHRTVTYSRKSKK